MKEMKVTRYRMTANAVEQRRNAAQAKAKRFAHNEFVTVKVHRRIYDLCKVNFGSVNRALLAVENHLNTKGN